MGSLGRDVRAHNLAALERTEIKSLFNIWRQLNELLIFMCVPAQLPAPSINSNSQRNRAMEFREFANNVIVMLELQRFPSPMLMDRGQHAEYL